MSVQIVRFRWERRRNGWKLGTFLLKIPDVVVPTEKETDNPNRLLLLPTFLPSVSSRFDSKKKKSVKRTVQHCTVTDQKQQQQSENKNKNKKTFGIEDSRREGIDEWPKVNDYWGSSESSGPHQ